MEDTQCDTHTQARSLAERRVCFQLWSHRQSNHSRTKTQTDTNPGWHTHIHTHTHRLVNTPTAAYERTEVHMLCWKDRRWNFPGHFANTVVMVDVLVNPSKDVKMTINHLLTISDWQVYTYTVQYLLHWYGRTKSGVLHNRPVACKEMQ